jgi:hypothetical protein
LIINAIHCNVVRPVGPEGEAAELLLNLARSTTKDSSIEASRIDTILDPADEACQDVLREWAVGLFGVGTAVGGAGDEEEPVLVVQFGVALIKSGVRVHDLTDRVVVYDR